MKLYTGIVTEDSKHIVEAYNNLVLVYNKLLKLLNTKSIGNIKIITDIELKQIDPEIQKEK